MFGYNAAWSTLGVSMDVALKQRLVGASVLVTLGVILIPMLLQGPRENRDATSIPIPEQPERGFETRLLPVEPPDPDAAEAAPAPTGRGEVVSVPTAGAAAPDPTASADPAAAPTGGGRETGRWALQLGSFGNAANAQRLVTALSEAGWSAFHEKVEVADTTLYRVRSGPYSSRAEAERQGERIAARFADLDVAVRELEGAATRPAPALSGWLVQVGSFANEGNALSLRDRLRAAGFTAHVEAHPGDPGGDYKVRVGPELDRAAAEELRGRLREEFELNGILVDHP